MPGLPPLPFLKRRSSTVTLYTGFDPGFPLASSSIVCEMNSTHQYGTSPTARKCAVTHHTTRRTPLCVLCAPCPSELLPVRSPQRAKRARRAKRISPSSDSARRFPPAAAWRERFARHEAARDAAYEARMRPEREAAAAAAAADADAAAADAEAEAAADAKAKAAADAEAEAARAEVAAWWRKRY